MKDADATTVNNILSSSKLRIPRYQRSYSWTEKEVVEFLDDIKYTIENNSDHYFGTIVLAKRNDFEWSRTDVIPEYDIVDGQQRMTTVTLLAKCIYNELETIKKYVNDHSIDVPINFENELLSIKNKFIGKIDSTNTKLRLKPDEVSRDTYIKILSDTKIERTSLTLPERRLLNAVEVIEDRICSWREEISQSNSYQSMSVEEITEISDYLLNYINTVGNEFRITKNVVEDINESARMFKVINDRGRDLTLYDMIKSHLIYYASQSKLNTKTISKKLNEVSEEITQYEGTTDDTVDGFIKAHWTVFTGEYRGTRTKMSPQKINERIKLKQHASVDTDNDRWVTEYINSLHKHAEHYIQLTRPRLLSELEISDEELEKSVNNKMRIIMSLRSSGSYIPLLMTVKKYFGVSSSAFQEILSLVECFAFRYNHIIKNGQGLEAQSANGGHIVHWLDTTDSDLKDLFGDNYNKETYDSDYNAVEEIKSSIKQEIQEKCPNKKFKRFLSQNDVLEGKFTDNWTGFREKKTIKLLLYEYEKSLRRGSDTASMQLPDQKDWISNYEIEHISPQNPKDSTNLKNHDQNCNRLGNLAIIGPKDNKSISNNKFKNKRKSYKKSNISMLNEISKNNSWAVDEIDKRTESIVEFCLARWPYKESLYKQI